MELLKQISETLQKGDHEQVVELTRQALAENLKPKDILDKGFIAGMDVVGEQFGWHEIFLPDVLMAAKAMHFGMELLKPLLESEESAGLGRVVIGTVQGDLHDIGKNLVGIMLRGAGFEVIDLGNDVSPEDFVETAITEKADVIGMSALLTTTMSAMKKVTALLKEKMPDGSIKTIVGGAPLSARIAEEFGADEYAYDAANAVKRVKQLVP